MKRILREFRKLISRRMFIALLILAQIAMLATLFVRSYHLLWFGRMLNVISIVTALHLMTRPDKTAFKLSLVFLILLFPIFGGALYWIMHFQTAGIGFRRFLKEIEKRTKGEICPPTNLLPQAKEAIPEHIKQIRYLQNTSGFPLFENTDARYFPGGKPMLDSLLKDLKTAEHYIFLEYFIVEEGKMWDPVLEILKEKAAAGVEVRVVYDDLGCFLTLPQNYAKKLNRLGIQCRVFNKFHPFLTCLQNNRDHRKIAVIDGKIAYTGGVNLADEYIGEKIRFGTWKDSAVRLCGDAAWSFTVMFLQIWELLLMQRKSYSQYKQEDYSHYKPKEQNLFPNSGWIQPYTDSPLDGETVGEHVYLQIMQNAKDYLYITTPYLMIDDNLLSALKSAAKSGVDVRILTPGIPDKKTVHFTTRSYYRELLDAGIRVYEFKDGFVHSKTFVSDDSVATVGTVNLDFRSLYLHFECGTCLYCCPAVLDIKQDFLNTLPLCREITRKDCKAGPFKKLFQNIMRIFAPLM